MEGKRRGLSADHLDDLWKATSRRGFNEKMRTPDLLYFSRAIERAHGIAPAIAERPDSDIMQRGAERMITERDGIILGLIRHVLQRNDLAPDEIEPGRLECICLATGGPVTWRIDGRPIAQFEEPEVRRHGRSVEFVQRYRVLL
jgi:hypothetical protein